MPVTAEKGQCRTGARYSSLWLPEIWVNGNVRDAKTWATDGHTGNHRIRSFIQGIATPSVGITIALGADHSGTRTVKIDCEIRLPRRAFLQTGALAAVGGPAVGVSGGLTAGWLPRDAT